jgi:aspartate/methionine/tyrosine aminotransferase
VDPTPDQWKAIADVCGEREAVLIFDTAYQVWRDDLNAMSNAMLRYDDDDDDDDDVMRPPLEHQDMCL